MGHKLMIILINKTDFEKKHRKINNAKYNGYEKNIILKLTKKH